MQDPRAVFFGEAAPVTAERRGLTVGVHDLRFTHVLLTCSYHIYVYDGVNRDLSATAAQKTTQTDILCCRSLLKLIPLRILASKFQRPNCLQCSLVCAPASPLTITTGIVCVRLNEVNVWHSS